MELWEITWLTLKVSASAVMVSILLGLPAGTGLALGRFRGRRFLMALANAGMGLPPVVVGLTVAIMLWRTGPLGGLALLYTPAAMVIAQVVIALPIVTGLTAAAVQSLDQRIRLESLALGASTGQLVFTLWREAKLGLLAAAMAGFGGAISEVGAVLMVGGNIKGQTRVLTTAIVMETRMGHFNAAIALSALLLALVFFVNLVLTYLQQGRRP
ncbi:MAG: ABC transporter permease [Actinomycetota bacterium]|nr:ABC transporter permease [Actinomycetota bacterium]